MASGGPTGSDVGGWRHRSGWVDLDRPVIMGVLNVTPDSFSDGGRYGDPDRALEQAERMLSEGAAIIDLGGESTRPGAQPIDAVQEIGRVVPVLRRLRSRLSAPISIDTRRALVARAAIDEGADIVNDVSALADPEMPGVVATAGAGVVLMHMRGTPETMQNDPRYDDVALEVADGLRASVATALAAGIPGESIVVDPGVGFGKTFDQNLELIARLDVLARLGLPILLGVSRKAFLGALIGGAPPEDRVTATAAACVVGLAKGARIFRVHDVRPVREALDVAHALLRAPHPVG